jgi:polar amino acid transport system substrate-binding protein
MPAMKFAWIAEPPFNFRKDGVVTGCDAEVARTVFAVLGEAFEPVKTEFADLLPGLADARWDVTTGMFATPERAARAHFTLPIWSLRDGLLVKARDAAAITGYRSIAEMGGRLAVLEGQVQREAALRLGVPQAAIVTLQGYEEAAQTVADGRVLAYASVELAHRAYIAQHPASGLACVAVPEDEKPADAGAFACQTAEIRDRLDSVLRGYIGSTKHLRMLAGLGLEPEALGVRPHHAGPKAG